jgi:UDP-2,3-diacylglucosamine pyrophosphatase LpxH
MTFFGFTGSPPPPPAPHPDNLRLVSTPSERLNDAPDTRWVPDLPARREAARSATVMPEPMDALIISDLHLGSENCQAKALVELLEQVLEGRRQTPKLIINGDVFDSIDFRRLKKSHWKVLSLIRHLSDKIEVIWIAGNHDGSADIVSHLLGVSVHEEYVLSSGGRRVLAIHGHAFDDFIDEHPLLTWFADCIYAGLQKLDRTHYVARLAKRSSKTFLHCVDKIEKGAVQRARQRRCDMVVCGHTHHGIAKRAQEIPYFNSGCWTERHLMTYLTVASGRVELHTFEPAAVGAEVGAV